MRISDWSSDVCSSDLFETEVRALWVPSGTAANCLALAALCPPHGSVICHRDAHIENDECGPPEFYTHGANQRLPDGPRAKPAPESNPAATDGRRAGGHHGQPLTDARHHAPPTEIRTEHAGKA